jgi:hypothetical protein
MGMGYGANYGWEASNKWLESLELDGWAELKQYLLEYGEKAVYESINCDENLTIEFDELDPELLSKLRAELRPVKVKDPVVKVKDPVIKNEDDDEDDDDWEDWGEDDEEEDESITPEEEEELTKRITAELFSVWERVCNDFSAKTKLDLTLCYHDSNEEGDRYDEIDGLVYLVTKVVTFTKPGKEQVDAGNIRKVFWVTYG